MQTDNQSKLRPQRRFLGNLFFALILIIGIWALLNRQFIVDTITVWQFKPSDSVEQLSSESGMNNNGRFLYMASKPELNDRTSFNNNCETREAQTMILGCYSSGDIYIFDVTDKSIEGVEAVTAAHEMLHAAYARLSDNDRKHLDQLLADELSKITDQSMLDLVKMYDKTEPGQRHNELHSLFGTQLNSLPTELEDYYKKYFANRAKVVLAYEKYRKVFADLETAAKDLKAKLDQQRVDIERDTKNYELDAADFAADIKAFNERAATKGGFSSESEFNYERSILMERQSKINSAAESINDMVKQYNKGVEEINALGIEVDKLNQNLNSKTQTIN